MNKINKKITNSEEVRLELFDNNIKLVNYCIGKYFSGYCFRYYDDMYQEGLLALWDSTKHYDKTKSVFVTYASSYILGRIRTFINYQTISPYKIPRTIIDNIRKFKLLKSKSELSTKNLDWLNKNSKKVEIWINDLQSTISLDYNLTDKDGTQNDVYSIGQEVDKRDNISEWIDLISIEQSIDLIVSRINNEVHKKVYEEYIYTKLAGDSITHYDLCKKYNLSQSYISRIISLYNKKLYKLINEGS